jgi:flavin-dependent dehydrogenase
MMQRLVKGNRRACQTLEGACPVGEWLAVAVSQWGLRTRPEARNLSAVGDAGAFIDPFTGSGILTALESAALFARIYDEYATESLSAAFHRELRRRFRRRLLTSAMIRPAALSHRLGSLAVAGLGLFASPLEFLARSTRPRTLGNKNLWAP